MTKLDIERLSHHEKLELMSLLWDSLDKSRLEISKAHKEVLDQRLEDDAKGTAEYMTWEEAKQNLKQRRD